jgi:hypothetical protein
MHGRHAERCGSPALCIIAYSVRCVDASNGLNRPASRHATLSAAQHDPFGSDSRTKPRINSPHKFDCTACKARRHRHRLSISRARSPYPLPKCRGGLGPLRQPGEGLAARRSLRRRSRVMNLFEQLRPHQGTAFASPHLFSGYLQGHQQPLHQSAWRGPARPPA